MHEINAIAQALQLHGQAEWFGKQRKLPSLQKRYNTYSFYYVLIYLVVYSCPLSPKELNRCGRTQRTQRWGTCVSISADILTSIILQGWQMDHTDKEKPSTMWPTLGKFGTQLNIHQKKGHN